MWTYIFNINCIHVFIRDPDASFIDFPVKHTDNRQSSPRGSGLDQIHHSLNINQRLSLPVLCDVAEEAVLDLIIFGCPWWVMDDLNFFSDFLVQCS